MTITYSASVARMSEQPTGIAELDQRIPFLLSQLGAYVADDAKRRLAPLGVHPRVNAILFALAGSDGQSQRQLSARLGLPHRHTRGAGPRPAQATSRRPSSIRHHSDRQGT